MSNWRRQNGDNSGDEPRPLVDSLGQVTRRLGMASPAVLQPLFLEWPKLVGESLAAAVRPRELAHGVLTVEVDDPAWATQLRFLEADLVQRLNERLGAGTVSSLFVRTPRPGANRRGPRRVTEEPAGDPPEIAPSAEGTPRPRTRRRSPSAPSSSSPAPRSGANGRDSHE